MLGCHGCQEMMLDHLYDLLDEADQRAFLDHLAGCPACRVGLDAARAQKNLLGRAARLHFPKIAFTPPGPDTLPLPARPTRRLPHWAGWAAAAGVLLALAGLGVPAYRAQQEYGSAHAIVAAHDVTVASARAEAAATRDALAKAAKDRDEQVEKIRHEIKARELRLVVTGPRNLQPGAPADYLVKAVDLNDQPAEADIVARLVDATRPVASGPVTATAKPDATTTVRPKMKATTQPPGDQKRENAERQLEELTVTRVEPGSYRVRIPPTVPLRPGQSLGMVVAARKKPSGESLATGRLADTWSRLTRAGEQVSLLGEVQLTAPVYLTHLTTDKPMYQPGEVVRFRSLTLDRYTLAPSGEDFRLHYTVTTPLGAVQTVAQGVSTLVQVEDKKSVVVNGPDGKPIRGVGAGELPLDGEAPGGEYTLTVTEAAGRFPSATRKFTVNRYQKPRLDKKLDFGRSSYGPGDEVQARLSATRADGGAVANRPVEITVTIDDRLYDAKGNPATGPIRTRTGSDGVVTARVKLPASIDKGAASLAAKFDDGAAVETISRTIPLVLKKLDVEFFPEGGDLVAGLPNRVYFQARTPLGKPAQLRGTLLENGKPTDVTLATLHDEEKPGVNQGQGVFAFTPKTGKKYEVRIDSPQGIQDRKALPALRDDGVVLSVPRGVFKAGEPIRVQVRTTRPRTLLVGAYCRGQLLATAEVGNDAEAVLKPTSGAGGVCRITVFEDQPTGGPQRQLRPVAERLVYRHPKERLDISITPDQRRYVPGQKAKLSIATTNESERPVPALAMVAVVDQSVVTMADEKTDRTMPTHFLLTTEVRRAEDLEYADFLLGTHPKAAPALDLLLGTQGWRRFAEQNPERFRQEVRRQAERLSEVEKLSRESDAERLLVMTGQSSPQTTDFDREKLGAAVTAYAEQVATLQKQHARAAQTFAVAVNDDDYRAALAAMGRLDRKFAGIRSVAVPALGVAAVLLGLAALILALADRTSRALACLGLTAACALLLTTTWYGPGGDRPTAAVAARESGPAVAFEDRFAIPLGVRGADAAEKAGIDAPKAAAAAPIMLDDRNDAIRAGAGGKPGGLGGLAGVGIAGGMGSGRGMGAPGAPAPQQALRYAVPFGMPGSGLRPGPATRGAMPMKKADDEVARRRAGLVQLEKKQNVLLRAPIVLRARQLKDDAPAERKGLPKLLADRLHENFGTDKDSRWSAEPLVFREYAHVRPKDLAPEMRTDFAETLYWHPVLLLPDGKGEVSFELCDSVTSFQVAVLAHTLDGRLGAATKLIESRLPFTLSPKVPTEVTATDRLHVPIAVANNTNEARQVELKLTDHAGFNLVEGENAERFNVPAEGRTRRLLRLKPNLVRGVARLSLQGHTAPFAADGITETVKVVPDGFPVSGASSDLLEKSATHNLDLPAWLPGTLEVRLDVYPSTLADLQKGLEGLLREPSGCFEQSSTANYPNVLILDYLESSKKASPEVEKRSRELLDRGYKRLTSFECQEPSKPTRRGYEWFGGQAAPHEALTAYGLLQFRDMAKYHEVDREMLARTEKYLLDQRDGNGGFKRNARALDQFGRAPAHVTNAYIVWALTESGGDADLAKELDALATQAKSSEDGYFLSLVGLSLTNRGRAKEAGELLRKVAASQKTDGQVASAQTSITGSGGRDLVIETTALATLGWLKNDALAFDRPIRNAVRWIGQQRGGHGAFGSTQSTILALKALIAWTKANNRTPEAGELRLYIGDDKVAALPFPAGVDRTLSLTVPEPEKRLKPGVNRLRAEITGAKNVFPHTLGWSCRTPKPASAKNLNVKLDTQLARTALAEGDSVRLTVKLENVSGRNQGMAVAIVGLPAGLIVPEDLKQLKEHCKIPEGGKKPLLGAFEVQGRELVLYWRDLAKDQKLELPIDLIARVPGEYRGPASRAYLYYNADHRHWIDPLSVTITAK